MWGEVILCITSMSWVPGGFGILSGGYSIEAELRKIGTEEERRSVDGKRVCDALFKTLSYSHSLCLVLAK